MIFDGAMGTSLQSQNLTAEHFGGERTMGCNDYLVITHPQAVETVHRSFLDVGVDVIETCTFRSNRLTLGEYGLGEQVMEINRVAAQLARKLADEYSRSTGHPRFVAGSIGPTGKLPSMNDSELSNITFDELADIFREQSVGLIEGGVDLLIIETSQDILEVKAAIDGVQRAFLEMGQYLPIQAQVTLDTAGRMLLGTDIHAVMAILEPLPVDVIGINCSTGPEHMREPIRILGETSNLPVSCIPNAGLPINVDGQAVYPLQPEPFADALLEFVEKNNISVVGGCCGTTPAHLEKVVEKLHNHPNPRRPRLEIPRLASAIQAVDMQQEPAPFLIGERLNTAGSAKFKQLVLADDFDGSLSIARQQVNNGAHGLDLCVALTERPDEAALMTRLIKTLASTVRIPFVIDSTEPDVMEAALKTAPGRCLLNSTHLEGGRDRADRVFGLAKRYSAAVICLTIDEQGMARIADRKLTVANRLYEIATREYGLRPCDLVFDGLTFTLATGDPDFANSAVETLDAIPRIKAELPGVLTSLGISNVSFGLQPEARAVINSVFLFHAVQAGLDMAIVNPAHITPYAEIPEEERELAEDLIFNRRENSLSHLLQYFHTIKHPTGSAETTKSALQSLPPEERLHRFILQRQKEGVAEAIDEIINQVPAEVRNQAAVNILNSVLLPAMKEVGDKFGTGELILPFVLQSAEVMKKAVAHLEKYLERKEGISKGRVVLATVHGDVHDIGKNLVKTILINNGYTVFDLGKQVPVETIITKAVENNADAIGLSALLVNTSRQMPLIVNELHRRGLQIPVLIGGAAINRRFGHRILLTDNNEWYPTGVFYCKDAFEGLSTMDALTSPDHTVLLERIRQEAALELGRNTHPFLGETQQHSGTPPAASIPRVPGWGVRIVQEMPLESVFNYLSINELYRLSWGAKNIQGEAWEKIKAEFDSRLNEMQQEAVSTGWLKPRGVYGYFPAQANGDDVVIYDPVSLDSSPIELTRFHFPRQSDGEYLCLADYFTSVESGIMDVVALQVVTVGKEATDQVDRLQATGDYSAAYFLHGLAVQTAEAAAEYLHQHIRRELGLASDQGKRYSWGYPPLPNLNDHARVFRLLPVERELGMSLTSAFQLVPEQSTAALIVHHPQAKYFNIGDNRIDQLLEK